MENSLCTIMTPTYNRAYIIENLYDSLRTQTSKNFEWIIIDDGSTDNTSELISKFIEENLFTIKYFKQSNGGKHRAVNMAIDLANGEYFFIVDSDDILPEKSIETIFKWFKSIEDKENFAGIGGLKKYINTPKIVGNTFKQDYIDCTSLEREKYNILGDKAEVFYTTILKKFKFPEFENEKFLSEAVLWNEIARHGYKIRWFNESIYECEYLEDGLTKNIINQFSNSPNGFALYIKTLTEDYKINLIKKYYYYGMFYSNVKNVKFKNTNRILEINKLQILISLILYKIVKLIKV